MAQSITAESLFREWVTQHRWRATKQGWPDFICRRNGAVMAVEVKDRDGLSGAQHETLSDLAAAGIPTYVWTPASGLRPYPVPAPAESPAALILENERLAKLLAQVTAERNDLARREALPEPVAFVGPMSPYSSTPHHPMGQSTRPRTEEERNARRLAKKRRWAERLAREEVDYAEEALLRKNRLR